MSLSAAERETTLTIDDEEKVWLVTSYRRSDITRMKKNPDLVVIEEGMFEGTPFLHGTLPLGGIAIRAKSAGSIKRGTRKMTATTCSGTKADGKPCGSIAGPTGRCARHPI